MSSFKPFTFLFYVVVLSTLHKKVVHISLYSSEFCPLTKAHFDATFFLTLWVSVLNLFISLIRLKSWSCFANPTLGSLSSVKLQVSIVAEGIPYLPLSFSFCTLEKKSGKVGLAVHCQACFLSLPCTNSVTLRKYPKDYRSVSSYNSSNIIGMLW